ncbi:hypothetical protein BFR06_24195 [Burkholderia pseudomallei]|uniref:Phage protein n=2 Tax=Burkholderia pseudomallei TaxID=28450 RepID=Q63YM9_BURPS|nr:hypothetical protein PQA64_gp20 [Burkholderia phage PhiBP82.2]AFI68172.1 hypothetical protein BP1026B_I3607 [Burkholderia pseudomallei 1026b]APF94925.1 hypothetical protein BFR05_24175 [Burkholderia pseudomallei]EIF64528.1 hypothetical protein BP1026A_1680 [Burkholderia pseudomallei 1026a]QWY84961.1 hypothetical protein PK23_18 [Burkholderia phage PK23]CAH34145.1 putative phage protein [Burkholderia pseudomallei K96243]
MLIINIYLIAHPRASFIDLMREVSIGGSPFKVTAIDFRLMNDEAFLFC